MSAQILLYKISRLAMGKTTIQQVQDFLDNPPKPIKWKKAMGDLIKKKGERPKISLLCSCGNTKTIFTAALFSLNTKSCGCFRQETRRAARTHGETGTPLHKIWRGMRKRTLYHRCDSYKYYGGKGISLCEDWLNSFIAFKDWSLANGYQNGLSIDRIKNNLGYSPDNCRWVTKKEQAKNKTTTILVTIEGETLCMSDWCKKLNVSRCAVDSRIKKGMSHKEALLTSPKKRAKM